MQRANSEPSGYAVVERAMRRIYRAAAFVLFVPLLLAIIALFALPAQTVRAAPMVYIVTIAADDAGTAGDCATSTNTDCSLRSAINASNNNAPGVGATNTINFSISTGLQTITLTASLPDITAPLTIDGTSQPVFGGTPIIEVNGNGHGAAGGLILDASASGSTIKGLILGGFQLSGIYIPIGSTNNTISGNYIGTDASGSAPLANGGNGVMIAVGAAGNTIGGTTAAARNIISGNARNGVLIDGSRTTGNFVVGNYIGTNAANAATIGNGADGVVIQSGTTNNTIGGTTAGAGNVISGNAQFGVLITDSGTTGNTVAGNYIGTNAIGTTTLRNGNSGVVIQSGTTGNTIGGTAAGARNVISGNGGVANVQITNSGTTGNAVAGNYIGTNAAGDGKLTNSNDGIVVHFGANANTISGNLISGNPSDGVSILSGSSANTVQGNQIGVTATGGPLGNGFYGVSVRSGSTNNTIGGTNAGEGNLIAFSGRQGVVVTENTTTGNAIRGNSIHDNAALGIDLNSDGVTANGVNPRTFPNNGQNYPVLTTATFSNGTVTITGTLTSTASTTFHLDFYANTAADPTGYGEGQSYLGSQDVTTDGTGNLAAPFTVTVPIPPGQHVITATATNATTNDTSEFAQDLPLPTLTIGTVSQPEGNSGTTPFTFPVTLSAASGQTVTVNYATADGTATVADNDYQATSGTLTFTPSQTSKTITVLVNGDTKAEPDETFTVVLSIPTNATIATGTGTGTIVNDDGGLILTPTSLPNGTVGQPYSQQIVVSNGTAPYTFSLAGGTLPAGLTLGTDGTLAGTPTAANPFTFTVQAKDAGGVTGSQQYTVTINAAPMIVLSPVTLPPGMKGVASSQTLVVSGGAGPYTFTITAGTPPSGLTLDPTTGVLSGTPTAANTFSFTVQAKDANGFTGSQQYTVTVSAAPLTSIALAAPSGAGNPPSVKVGQIEQFTAMGTYADNSRQDVTTQVRWMSSDPNVATVDPTTGKVTGESPGTVTITAALNGVTQTITVTVAGPTPIGITVAPAPAARPAGTTSQPGSSPAPAPAPRPAPATGASAQGVGPTGGSAPAPVPTGR